MKYCAPARRYNNGSSNEFRKKDTEFPLLGGVTPLSMHENILDFSVIAQKTDGDPKDKNPLKPGWVRLTKGVKLPAKPGKQEYDTCCNDLSCNISSDTIDNVELDKLVDRWQTERDKLNNHLGESSPYWNVKSLHDDLSGSDYETSESEHDGDDVIDEANEDTDGDY